MKVDEKKIRTQAGRSIAAERWIKIIIAAKGASLTKEPPNRVVQNEEA